MQTTRLAERRRPSNGPGTTADLKPGLREAGVNARRIDIKEVTPGLHEKAEGIRPRPVYLITRRKSPAGRGRASGRFVKIPCEDINLPPEGKTLVGRVAAAANIEECAVFLSTRLADAHLGLVLAVRIAGAWFELYRWVASWNKLGLSRLEVSQF
jgi:hypothetical protein